MDVKCPNCGTDNTQDSEFCKKCGTQIIKSEEQPIPTKTLEAPKEELTTGSTFAGTRLSRNLEEEAWGESTKLLIQRLTRRLP
jgi:hypothetical protein